MGVPINQAARSQSNLVVGDVSSFKSDIAKFSNMVIPMMWLDIVGNNKKNRTLYSCTVMTFFLFIHSIKKN